MLIFFKTREGQNDLPLSCLSLFVLNYSNCYSLVSASSYVLIGWNDLGMHCISPRFKEMSILPPYNNLVVQVIRKGDPPKLITSENRSTVGVFRDMSHTGDHYPQVPYRQLHSDYIGFLNQDGNHNNLECSRPVKNACCAERKIWNPLYTSFYGAGLQWQASHTFD